MQADKDFDITALIKNIFFISYLTTAVRTGVKIECDTHGSFVQRLIRIPCGGLEVKHVIIWSFQGVCLRPLKWTNEEIIILKLKLNSWMWSQFSFNLDSGLSFPKLFDWKDNLN